MMDFFFFFFLKENGIMNFMKWWINEELHQWLFDKPKQIVYYWYLKYPSTQRFFLVIAQWLLQSMWSSISFPKIHCMKNICWNLFPYFDATWVPPVMTSLWQANMRNDKRKCYLHLIFSLYLNKDTSGIIPCQCISLKKNYQWSLCWPIYWQSKLSLKLLDCGRKIQTHIHIDTYYCKPEHISWR